MYLSEILKKPVLDGTGKKIGRLKDAIVSSEVSYPIIKAIIVDKDDKKTVNIPYNYIDSIGNETKLKTNLDEIKEYKIQNLDIRLLEDVLDRQVVDIEDKKVRRVNDINISRSHGYYHIIGVDIGFYGILKRLGLEKIAKPLHVKSNENIIAWEDIDTLNQDYSKLKLKVAKQSIKKLHPADIAEIVDQLGLNESINILNSLDDEAAADTLEEVSPERQAYLLEGMDVQLAVKILDEMDPDDAADVLGNLPEETAEELLGLLEPKESEDIRTLLEYPENTAGGIMTTEYAYIEQDLTVGEVMKQLRDIAKDVETIYYVYVLGDGKLTGVLSLRDILLAEPDMKISEVMISPVITIDIMEEEEEVAQKIAKYNLLALPVVEDENKLKGIVTVDDAIDIVLPVAWKKRVPRMFR